MEPEGDFAMAVNLSSAYFLNPEAGELEKALLRNIERRVSQLRPLHPVSLLDLSPADETAVILAGGLRDTGRKIRLMTYEWCGPKHPERIPGASEVLVEKGRLPGLHFSEGGFDYITGCTVLGSLEPDLRARALSEMRRTALRDVVLVESSEGAAAISESQLRDTLLEAGCGHGNITNQSGLLIARC